MPAGDVHHNSLSAVFKQGPMLGFRVGRLALLYCRLQSFEGVGLRLQAHCVLGGLGK